jgi:hypothetical protein
MEILPGVGVPSVQLGEDRAVVEVRIGTPTSAQASSAFYTEGDSRLVLRYSGDDKVELIEIPYSGEGHEATLNGIQLTFRPIDDVIEDLRQAGLVGRQSDIGFDFPDGFAIWSMGSLDLSDIDTSVSADDERLVVEGVSVGRRAYFDF